MQSCALSQEKGLSSEVHGDVFVIDFPEIHPAENVGCKTVLEAERAHVDFSLGLSGIFLLPHSSSFSSTLLTPFYFFPSGQTILTLLLHFCFHFSSLIHSLKPNMQPLPSPSAAAGRLASNYLANTLRKGHIPAADLALPLLL